MVTLESTAERSSGVTLVRVRLTNTRSTVQTVRLRNLLAGPTWPSRRDGVVDPRWDGDRWAVTIRPGRSRGVGFASPSPPTDPPVEVVSAERYDGTDPARSAAGVLADLDGWRPTNELVGREP